MKRKGMLKTRKEAPGGQPGGGNTEGDGDSDYEIREDGVELTESEIVRKKTGTWSTVNG